MLDQRIDRPLRRSIGRKIADRDTAANDDTITTLLPDPRIGSNCCTRKNGARTLTAN
jgi:hypothetical protein